MVTDRKKILIIEDDKDIRETVKILLESDGFCVFEAENGELGLSLINPELSLVILDVMLGNGSGFEVCRAIRQFSYVPILFLTAKSKDEDKIIGFASGGDDYLTKPFSYSELSARVKALIRRRMEYDQNINLLNKQNDHLMSHGGITINLNYNQLLIEDKAIELTQTEYEILRLLMNNPQKIFSVQEIYESVWDEKFSNSISNTVMVHIRNLRAKIESTPQKPQIIVTVWGKGYRFGEI